MILEKKDKEKAFQLKRKNLPPSLFKYRSADAFSLKNLDEGTIWLSDPIAFNNPFDSLLSWDIIEILDDLLVWGGKDAGELFINNHYPNLSRSQRRNQLRSFMRDKSKMRELLLQQQKQFKEKNSRNLQRYREAMKICSFTERLDTLPMWAHYANNHRGFCMEYKLSSLTSEFAENVFPVLYTQEGINSTSILKQYFSGNKRINPDRILMVPFIKSIDWSYEKEWRYVLDNPALKNGLPLKIGFPDTVYLGNKLNEEHVREIEDICKRRNIKMAQKELSSKKMGMVPVFHHLQALPG